MITRTHTCFSTTQRNAQVTAAQLRKAQAAAEAGKKAAGAEEEEGSLDGVAALVGLLPSGAAVAEDDESAAADGASVASGSSKGSRRTKGSGRGQGGKALAVGRCVFCEKEFKLCSALRWLC